jgi:acyl-CoA thioesterase-2
VDRSRDGNSFSARRVVAIQHGRPIFTMAASFQVAEEGLEHQFDAPDVPGPDDIEHPMSLDEDAMKRLPPKIRRWIKRCGPFDFRHVGGYDPVNPKPTRPFQKIWFRLNGKLPDDPVLHRALLAYISDFNLVGTATLPHGLSWVQGNLVMASLDHAMWFHREARLDDWLLYDCDSPSTSSGRGLARGMIYDRAGRLVASTAQEGVIRVKKSESTGEEGR